MIKACKANLFHLKFQRAMEMPKGVGGILCILCFLGLAYSQENAGSSVAPSIIECYNNTDFLTKDRLLPSTINVLLDLIRKVEDGPTALDARELSIQLIHRFRQDGIERSPRASNSPYSVPYSPRGKQADKNRILLQRLIPGNAVSFPNSTLTPLERCSLHYMLSNSVDLTVRGDEGTVCNRLSRYTKRVRRAVGDDDVELFDPKFGAPKGYLMDEGDEEETAEPPPEDEIPEASPDDDAVPVPDLRSSGITGSDCPIENGVVYTQWGAVQAGTVIAGIAAGYEKQEISTAITGYRVNSRYAVTIAGDLSEAALHQGTTSDTINIGVSGNWNSTSVPKYYFISSRENWEATDAEIRAGLDGLIMALSIESWKSSVSSLKVSQILDMYYSPRGVFNSTIRACNRQNLQTTVAPTDTLTEQTVAFNTLLDDIAVLYETLSTERLVNLGSSAVQSFLNYLPSGISDLSCASTGESVERAATDLIIALDTSWPYNNIQPALSYLLDYIDVNKFGTNVTLINGQDGSLIVNSSRSISDFHAGYNLTVHQSHPTGFNYIRVYTVAQQIMEERINNDTTLGGRSFILLLVPYSTSLSDEEKTFVAERKNVFKSYLPDLRPLLLGFGSKDNYAEAVFDSTYDVFQLSTTTDSGIAAAIKPVISRIKEIPRRIVNQNCKSDWSGTTSSGSIEQYVEPGTTNYYRIAPNYFYSDTGERNIKVRGYGYGSLVVCFNSQNDTCTSITSDEVTYDLSSHCSGHSLISSCPAFTFTVSANSTTTNYRCTDTGCRFPDNLKYAVSITNFGCASSSIRYVGSIFTLLIATILLQSLNK